MTPQGASARGLEALALASSVAEHETSLAVGAGGHPASALSGASAFAPVVPRAQPLAPPGVFAPRD